MSDKDSQDQELLRIEEVAFQVRVSQRTIRRMVKRGTFPKPINPSKRLVRWKQSQISEWLENQIRARDIGNTAADKIQVLIDHGVPMNYDKLVRLAILQFDPVKYVDEQLAAGGDV